MARAFASDPPPCLRFIADADASTNREPGNSTRAGSRMLAQIMSDAGDRKIDAVRNQTFFVGGLISDFGAMFCHAMASALFRVAASAFASRTCVLPCLP